MKSTLISLLSLGLVFSLTACGGGGDTMGTSVENMGSTLQETATEGDKVVEQQETPHYAAGVYGDINLTSAYVLPADALFLDVRNDWERANGYAKDSIGGVVYEYRKPNGRGGEDHGHRRLVETFVDDVLQKALGDKNKHIILICASSSRTAKASKLLAERGFTYVDHIKGGFSRWKELELASVKN